VVTLSNVKEKELKKLKKITSGDIDELKTDKFYFEVCGMMKSEIIEYIVSKLKISEDNIEIEDK